VTDKDFVDIVTLLRSPDRFEPYTCNAAADEIERLREELTASHESHGNEVGALTERLSLAIHERDEARRMYCYAIPENCDEHEARKIAWERGWDCFKEDGK
jgi:hypothetical protein